MRWARWALWWTRVEGALWVLALPGFLLGILAAIWLQRIDWRLEWLLLGLGSAGSQAFLAAMVSTLIAFVGIIFSVMVVIVQLASAQLSPRVIKPMMSGSFARVVLTIALFTLGYCFALLLRSGDVRVPQLALSGSIILSIVTIMGFLALLDSVARAVRFAAVIGRVSHQGAQAIERRYPRAFDPGADERAEPGWPALTSERRVVLYQGRPGLIEAYDLAGLARLAERHGLHLEAIRAQGEYVYPGAPLFRVEGAAASADLADLQGAAVIGLERAIPWDPAYALRLLVDIGIRALSPAINDPATAVSTIDAVQRLLALAGNRSLGSPDAGDRVQIPGPSWAGLLDLACTELRMCGRDSVQVLRRMRAMLSELARTLPAQRVAALERQLMLLDATADESSRQPEERALARQADPLGLG